MTMQPMAPPGHASYKFGGTPARATAPEILTARPDPPPWALYTAAGDAYPVISVDRFGNLYVYGVPVSAGSSGTPDWVNVLDFGATPGSTPVDSTAAFQAAFASGLPVYAPAGQYWFAGSLQWVENLIFFGDSAGTFPGDPEPDDTPGTTILTRMADANVDLIQIPDGTNYGRMVDIAIDGNKTQNTAGYGINIKDGAAGQETQIMFLRCYIHDNPYSNIYLGNNRRGSKLLFSQWQQSATGDGITVAGSDNHIRGNNIGSNGRAGIALGTTTTQNWAGAVSGGGSSDVSHVIGNDIFLNDVGIALAEGCVSALVINNGIDRNNLQGITVYDGDTNAILGNTLHSNSQAETETYAHIDLYSNVTQVAIDGNVFAPLDGGYTNLPNYGVNVETGAAIGCILGNIGVIDATSTSGGIISPQTDSSPPWTTLSRTGAVIQGNSGGDILRLLHAGGAIAMKITQNGSIIYPGSFQLDTQTIPPVAVSGAGVVYVDADGNLNYFNPTGDGGLATILGPYFYLPELAAPATPAAGGIMYVDATGHLHYLGPSGTDTVLAGP
jgi:parallel beta-helix repeat protein